MRAEDLWQHLTAIKRVAGTENTNRWTLEREQQLYREDMIMANTIYLERPTGLADPVLGMSNGLTDVFLNVLILSGSQLAKDEHEKRLIVWLAEQDQSAVGGGAVGFSVLDMPWNPETFHKDQIFMLKTIEAAKAKRGWGKLDYTPAEELLLPKLDQFAALISQVKQSELQPDSLEEWLAQAAENDPVRCGFPRCQKHHTLLSVFGCQICNN